MQHDLRYPIGEFEYGNAYSFLQIKEFIAALAVFPHNLTELVGKWGDERLDTPYRPEGWTVRQLVHHIADSHINAYVRTKLALTEDNPTIKGYEEAEWAKLPDSILSIAPSLVIISNLHQRWVTILDAMTEADFNRTYFHGGYQKSFELGEVVALYAWHSEHHYQHIYQLAICEGWV